MVTNVLMENANIVQKKIISPKIKLPVNIDRYVYRFQIKGYINSTQNILIHSIATLGINPDL